MRHSLLSITCFFLYGCIAHEQYRIDYRPCEVTAVSTCDASAVQYSSGANGARTTLGFVELDDQGQLWDRRQMTAVVDEAWKQAANDDLVLVVYVHGWQHDASPDDTDIRMFRNTLTRVASAEAEIATNLGISARKVFGVYVGWRGESVAIPLINRLTFWDRKNTAEKVGHRGMVEVLARLELVKETRETIAGAKGRSKLIVVGHSFGGAVAFNALSAVLSDRFVTTAGPPGVQSQVVGFGDLLVLINPAFEAMTYASLSDQSTERGSYFENQLPVVAILTSEADWATRYAFPAGRWLSTAFEKTRDYERYNATTKMRETVKGGTANRQAVGHFEAYRTHHLYPAPASAAKSAEPKSAYQQLVVTGSDWMSDAPGSRIAFDSLILERTATSAGRNPYLVVSVDKQIIPSHNEIDREELLRFIEQLILISSQGPEQLRMARSAK